ncbi:MAG: septum formation initiator family protein [Gammaproteobacteria bacterium]|jgi:cell division protein FtsB|nr:septum formation initiator family protein [Gammaproteobacteria bacterium]MDP6973532.1 septum formation initiator family protein [Gammaproteobacteria bacterium]
MRDKAHKGIVGFIVKYRVTFLLVIISAVLIKQNFLVNDFPNVIKQKQKSINEIVSTNKQLENENLELVKQIHGYTQEDMTLVESKARFKYGLIREGEVYYQIEQTRETDNIEEPAESTL